MITLQNIATSKKVSRFLVLVNGVEAGTIEKFKNTKNDQHPWKAFNGIGNAVKYMGAFYEGNPEQWKDCKVGGKDAAILAAAGVA